MNRLMLASIALLSCTQLPALHHDTGGGEQPVGKLVWKFKVGYRAYIAAGHGVIYAASPTGCSDFTPCGPPARLFALDDKTGVQKWMVEDIADDSAPVISDGLVYQAGGSLYALNAQTGQLEWKLKPSDRGTVMYSPAIAEGIIFFWEVQALIPGGFFGGTLYAFDLKTRQQKWKFSVDHGMVSAPVAADGLIYFGTTSDPGMPKGYLYALDATTGKVRWKFSLSGSSPAVIRGVVYYGSTNGILYALDARSGKKLWQFKSARNYPSPVVADQLVYLAVLGEHLHALDSRTGKEQWEFNTEKGLLSSPAIVDDVVYIGGFDGQLYALDAITGHELWRFTMGNALVSPPVVVNGVTYVASHDGYIYAIK